MFKSVSINLLCYMGDANVRVWVEGDELHYSKDVMRLPFDNTKDSVSRMSADEFTKRIEALKILQWKECYTPRNIYIMDGESWGLDYEDSKKEKHSSGGENAYPRKWIPFLDLITEAVGPFWDYGED